MLTLPVLSRAGILGSARPLRLDTLQRLTSEVGLSPSVNLGMPYPIRITASAFLFKVDLP